MGWGSELFGAELNECMYALRNLGAIAVAAHSSAFSSAVTTAVFTVNRAHKRVSHGEIRVSY